MKKIFTHIFFIILWTAMAIILVISAALICGVRLLQPRHLTPIIERVANDVLDADVHLGRAELCFEPHFPVLCIKLDSLEVISHAFADADTAGLPAYADSLLTLGAFRGSIDLGPMLRRGEIAIRDVQLVRPAVNIVLDANGRGNFDIYKSEPDSTSTEESAAPLQIPAFSIGRFAFTDPQEIRYFNAVDSTEATVVLLSDAFIDGHENPRFRIKIDGNMLGPSAKMLQLENLSFGVDGSVRWEPERPMLVSLEDFDIYGAFLHARVATEISFDSTLIVNSARLDLAPFAIEEALKVLPGELIRKYRLYKPTFATDATVSLAAELTRPFIPEIDSIPYATATLSIPDCSLRYGKADIRKLALDADITLAGNDLDSAVVVVRRFKLAGPATQLSLEATASQLIADPAFDACLKGDIDLRRLPPVLAAFVPGALSGRIIFDIDAAGATSMFAVNTFHKLDVRGKFDAKNLYFLSADTAKMVEITNAHIGFGSQMKRRNSKGKPSLGGRISVDTASILLGGTEVALANLSLGMAAENNAALTDSTIVVPLGGGIKVGRLNIYSITDSAGARMKDIAGNVRLNRFKGQNLPEIKAKLEVGMVSAGSLDTRFVLNKAHVDASMHKIPERAARRKAMKHTIDSIQHRYPELSPDSVYQLALEKRRHKPGEKRRKRVHGELTANDYEVLDWGLSKGFRTFLFDWDLSGTVTTRNARLFTPYFPLRNRMRNLDIAFNTDSLILSNVRFRAGHSDLTLNGIVSNLKRGLTSTSTRSPLKLNFNIASDTIDVNELAAATFTGSAYAERVRKGHSRLEIGGDESELDRQMDALASEHPDSAGPLLIPTNLDGKLAINAGTVLYDDLTMTNLGGEILLYDGGVNLHDLHASSDAGNLSLSALYSAPKATDMKFGLGLQLDDFIIERFLHLIPAVDSIMPIMRDFSGIINADIAATVDIDSTMNLELPTLDAAVRLTGDSLALINMDTWRTLGKWLRFRDRADNTIKHMNVEMIVKDNKLQIFPFSFDIDRYRLGIVGYNDLAMNFDYHIAVLKSPLPFKFGITLKGNPDKYKIRLGGAKFKEGMVAESVGVVDTARVNLIKQIENVFRRGVSNSRFAKLNVSRTPDMSALNDGGGEISRADSIALIREGMLPDILPADTIPVEPTPEKATVKKEKATKRSKKNRK